MTMLSPLGRVPQRAPRRRRSRRAWPLVIFVLIFAVAAIVVWWRVFSADGNSNGAASTCHSRSASSQRLDAHDVQVRVYNATTRAGLAAAVSRGLQQRGLDVVTTSNDPTHRKVTGVAEIRYGSAGAKEAKVLAAALPGGVQVRDSRSDAVVDIALGPGYRVLGTPTAVKQAIAKLNSRGSGASPSC